MQIENYSIEAQIELIQSQLKAYELDDREYEIYEDAGFSGAKLERPAIQKLINDCKNGKIETVLVYKLDRLSRSQKDTLYLIEEVFNKYDVGFISIREKFDTTSPFGKAMIGILSVFAQLERETIMERTRIGHKKRAEDGLWKGGGKIPYAYDYDKEKGMLIINEEKKATFDKIKSYRLRGYSYPQISKITGIHESLIQRMLKVKANLGIITYKGEEFEGRHEPIITREEYDQLQIIDKQRSQTKQANKYLLSGKLYCARCGAKYRYQKWGKRKICYCYSQQKSKPKLVKDPNCNNERIDSFEIEDAFLEELFKMSLNENLFRETFNLSKANMEEEIEKRLDKIGKKIKNLIHLLAEDIAKEEIKEELENLKNQKEEIIKEQEKLKETKKHEKIYDNIKNISIVWNDLEIEEKKSIVKELLDRIEIDGKIIKIYWNVS